MCQKNWTTRRKERKIVAFQRCKLQYHSFAEITRGKAYDGQRACPLRINLVGEITRHFLILYLAFQTLRTDGVVSGVSETYSSHRIRVADETSDERGTQGPHLQRFARESPVQRFEIHKLSVSPRSLECVRLGRLHAYWRCCGTFGSNGSRFNELTLFGTQIDRVGVISIKMAEAAEAFVGFQIVDEFDIISNETDSDKDYGLIENSRDEEMRWEYIS